jgi:hypothetical protein
MQFSYAYTTHFGTHSTSKHEAHNKKPPGLDSITPPLQDVCIKAYCSLPERIRSVISSTSLCVYTILVRTKWLDGWDEVRWSGSVTVWGSCAALQYDLFHCCISVTQKGNGDCQLHQTLVTFVTTHHTRPVLPKRCPAKPWGAVNENKGSARIFLNYWNTIKIKSQFLGNEFPLLLWNHILVPKVHLSMSMKCTFIFNTAQSNKMLTSYPCLTSMTNLTYVW